MTEQRWRAKHSGEKHYVVTEKDVDIIPFEASIFVEYLRCVSCGEKFLLRTRTEPITPVLG